MKVQEKNENNYGFDRSSIPYDAMGDYSVFLLRTDGKEERPCEGQDRDIRYRP